MQPLKILFHSHSSDVEKTDCFLQHIKSHALEEPIPLTQIDPKIILETLRANNSVAVMCSSLRFLIEPTRFTYLDCDIAVFTNKNATLGKRAHIDTSFILFQPKQKTFTFLQEWIEKLERMAQPDAELAMNQLMKARALSMQILPLSPLLKVESVTEEPVFHRWLMKV